MKRLLSEYKKKRRKIRERLKEFEGLRQAGGKDVFEELCFCLLTPQTKATSCGKAVEDLKRSGLLFKGCKEAVGKRLKGAVRFHNNKAAYVVAARKLFPAKCGSASRGNNGAISRLRSGDILETRDWLVENVKGLGYKEASHFLRNIGLGREVAIIDRHILKNLKKHKIIKDIPASLTRKRYLDIEDKMRSFSRRSGISMEELDLLFWSDRTGFIFK